MLPPRRTMVVTKNSTTSAGQHQGHGERALAAAGHVLGAEGRLCHGLAHPEHRREGRQADGCSSRISAKTMNSQRVEKPNSFLQAISASAPSRSR